MKKILGYNEDGTINQEETELVKKIFAIQSKVGMQVFYEYIPEGTYWF